MGRTRSWRTLGGRARCGLWALCLSWVKRMRELPAGTGSRARETGVRRSASSHQTPKIHRCAPDHTFFSPTPPHKAPRGADDSVSAPCTTMRVSLSLARSLARSPALSLSPALSFSPALSLSLSHSLSRPLSLSRTLSEPGTRNPQPQTPNAMYRIQNKHSKPKNPNPRLKTPDPKSQNRNSKTQTLQAGHLMLKPNSVSPHRSTAIKYSPTNMRPRRLRARSRPRSLSVSLSLARPLSLSVTLSLAPKP